MKSKLLSPLLSLTALLLGAQAVLAQSPSRLPAPQPAKGPTLRCQTSPQSRPHVLFEMPTRQARARYGNGIETQARLKATAYPFFGAEIAAAPESLATYDQTTMLSVIAKGIYIEWVDGDIAVVDVRKTNVAGQYQGTIWFPNGLVLGGRYEFDENQKIAIGCVLK